MYQARPSGFILLSTLLIMGVITLLVLTELQQMAIYAKALSMQARQASNFHALEAQAVALLQHEFTSLCKRNSDDANGILELLPQQGCNIQQGDVQYSYLMEDIGLFPCLQIQQGKRTVASHHWRLSLMQKTENSVSSYIQWRILKPAEGGECTDKIFYTRAGLSSWRYGVL